MTDARSSKNDISWILGGSTLFESFMASRKECIPGGVIEKPEDIAELIVLLSDRKRSSYIIGQSIVADGGSSLDAVMDAHEFQDMRGL